MGHGNTTPVHFLTEATEELKEIHYNKSSISVIRSINLKLAIFLTNICVRFSGKISKCTSPISIIFDACHYTS